MKSSKPPLATGPSFMPGAKNKLISPSEALKMQSDARSHSIGASREGKRGPQPLQQPQKRTLMVSGSQQAPAAAADFVKRLQKEKRDRWKVTQEMTQQKDLKFLTKLRETIDNRQKAEKMKEKDKQMRYEHMLKKLEAQKKERLSKLSYDKHTYFGQRAQSREKPN